jgi:AraC-like DNA-binding protein
MMDNLVTRYNDWIRDIPDPYGWSGINQPGELETSSGLWVTKAGARSFPAGFRYSPDVNPHWEWGAVLRGGLEFAFGDSVVRAPEGSAYVMPPDIRLAAKPVGQPFLVWAEVAGPSAGSAFGRFGGRPRELAAGKFSTGQAASVLRIARLLHEHPYGCGLLVQASLWSFLADSIHPGSAHANRVSPEIGRVLDFLELSEVPTHCTLKMLAGLSGLSVEAFRKRFARETGSPPVQYALKMQVKRAKELLSDNALTIKQAALSAGFDDPYYFSRLFKRYEGTSPSEYRKRFYPEVRG